MTETEAIARSANDGATVYVPAEGDQSWYGPLLITPYFDPALKIEFS